MFVGSNVITDEKVPNSEDSVTSDLGLYCRLRVNTIKFGHTVLSKTVLNQIRWPRTQCFIKVDIFCHSNILAYRKTVKH